MNTPKTTLRQIEVSMRRLARNKWLERTGIRELHSVSEIEDEFCLSQEFRDYRTAFRALANAEWEDTPYPNVSPYLEQASERAQECPTQELWEEKYGKHDI